MKKIKETVSLFLKGVLIGIANMIAGISGGTIAYITGIYEKMVSSLANLTKKFWQNLAFLIKIFLGVGVGIILGAKVLDILFDHILLEMILLFTGILIGSIYTDRLEYKLEKDEKKFKYIISFIVAFILVISLSIVNVLFFDKTNSSVELQNERWTNIKFNQMIILFISMIFGMTAMIFPGISGSLCLMIVGVYYPVLNRISDLTHLSNYSTSGFIKDSIFMILPLALGAITTLLFISKPINYCFNKYRKVCMFLILGFVVASLFSMYILNFNDIKIQYSWWHLPLSILVFLPIGVTLPILFNKLK